MASEEQADLEARLARTKRLLQWGDIDDAEYRRTRDEIQRRLRALQPEAEEHERLERPRAYIADLPAAWEDATQVQGNKLLCVVLEVVWVNNEKVVAIRPRPEVQPMFAV